MDVIFLDRAIFISLLMMMKLRMLKHLQMMKKSMGLIQKSRSMFHTTREIKMEIAGTWKHLLQLLGLKKMSNF